MGGPAYTNRVAWTYDPASDSWSNGTSFEAERAFQVDAWMDVGLSIGSGFLLEVAGALLAVNINHDGEAPRFRR